MNPNVLAGSWQADCLTKLERSGSAAGPAILGGLSWKRVAVTRVSDRCDLQVQTSLDWRRHLSTLARPPVHTGARRPPNCGRHAASHRLVFVLGHPLGHLSISPLIPCLSVRLIPSIESRLRLPLSIRRAGHLVAPRREQEPFGNTRYLFGMYVSVSKCKRSPRSSASPM